MAKKRYINTKFWSDDFIINLKPIERYFFLYLLTNEHTDICGIYELPIKIIMRETDLKEKEIIEIISLLKSKIVYADGWVYIKNFEKHQAVNPKVEEGIKRSKLLVPNEILAKLTQKDIDYDSLSKTTIETELLTPTLTLSPTPKLKPTLIPLTSEPSSQVDIKPIMEIFYKINPTLNWGNKTQRKACEEMIQKFGLGKTTKLAEYAISIQGQPFSPTITTPYQLKEKASQLVAYWQKQNQINKPNIVSI